MKLGKLVGTGRRAEVYEWGEDRVLKLFFEGFPEDEVEREYVNATIVKKLGFEKAREHGIVSYGMRTGIVYDKIEGETVLEYIIRTGEVAEAVLLMVRLHNQILSVEMFDAGVHYYKYHLQEALRKKTDIEEEEKERLREQIRSLPDGSQLCHGDLQIENVILRDGEPVVIDFNNVCRGPKLYDIARTFYLMKNCRPLNARQAKQIAEGQEIMAEAYLAAMRVTQEEIEEYLEVLAALEPDKELTCEQARETEPEKNKA